MGKKSRLKTQDKRLDPEPPTENFEGRGAQGQREKWGNFLDIWGDEVIY
ncbi:MAG: hypothetical protein ACYS18_09420 [Planctomycetota bacterium]|jgi:hypothetical protein